MSKSVYVSFIVLAVICLMMSIYAGWSLQQMINDQIDHGSILVRAGADAARGVDFTMRAGPGERFLGAGWLGTYAPTVLALLSVISFVQGWQGLSSSDEPDPAPQPAA